MTKTRQPRVAAIGLDGPQRESIASLCGQLRSASSVRDYLQRFNWTETDIVLSTQLGTENFGHPVNIMTIGSASFIWSGSNVIRTNIVNTERELTVSPVCPDLYKPLATELSSALSRAGRPPTIMKTTVQDSTTLIKTTSGHPVALRLVLPAQSEASASEPSSPIALLLPTGSDLAGWFRAFLTDLHESDPSRVPQAPPRLSRPSDWHTPEENALADRISEIESKLKRLTNERDGLQADLSAEGEKADRGIRQALWADGDDLVAAIKDVLAELGFTVRDIDAELKQNEPKREDLRLTLQEFPDWEAIVEVKGYPSGTKTNDARQIRQHRERYITEVGRLPDLTIWLSNEYRTMDPSSRPVPDQNVKDAAELIGTVHVLASDLYRQWSLVSAGSLDRETVIKSLMNAHPGLWTPPASDTGA